MHYRLAVFACSAILSILLITDAHADWVNLTGAETAPNIAEIRVEDERVEIAIEVFIDDIALFETPEDFGLSVRADDTELTPRVTLREPRTRVDRASPFAGQVDPRTGRKIPGPPDDDRVIFFSLIYELPPDATRVTFAPPVDDTGTATATVGMLVYHRAAPVIDYRYLSRAETLILDRDDPWFTAFENSTLSRHHSWPLMAFLYIEPRAVRHEALIRVRDLMAWTQFPGDAQSQLSAADQTALRDAARAYFATRNPVTIDGEPVSMMTFRTEFLNITPTGLRVAEPDTPVDASAAILGASQLYLIDTMPDTVVVDWELFDERVDRVPTNVIDPAGPFPGFLTEEYPQLEWKNFMRNYREPEVQPVTVGSDSGWSWNALRRALTGAPDEETAAQIVLALLGNAAVAFLERDPGSLDRALSTIVASESLADVRSELARAFAIATTGGGVASVETIEEVEVTELAELDSGDGFSVLAGWTSTAVGRHWGHEDRRVLRFRALMDFELVDSAWQLRGLTIIDLRQLGD